MWPLESGSELCVPVGGAQSKLHGQKGATDWHGRPLNVTGRRACAEWSTSRKWLIGFMKSLWMEGDFTQDLQLHTILHYGVSLKLLLKSEENQEQALLVAGGTKHPAEEQVQKTLARLGKNTSKPDKAVKNTCLDLAGFPLA